MSGQGQHGTSGSRKYKWRYGPFRLVVPWACIAIGLFHTVRAATGGMDRLFLITGPILIAVGVAAFFIARWMAKRGI
jgi:hypothetical protein